MTDRRTAKSQHFFDPQTGYGHSVITLHDQFYRDDTNVWQSVDENFETDGTEGFAQKMEKAAFRVRLKTDGGRRIYPRRNTTGEFVELGAPEFWNGSIWQTLPLGTPTRIGNTYIWDRATYSLVVTATWRKLKIDVVLKTSAAARRIRWPVSLTGLTLQGTTVFGQDGSTVAVIDRPFAVDAASITFPVTSTISGGFIEFNADLTGAVFPVDIDPTFTTQPDATAGNDTYIESGSPTTNHAVDSPLKVGGEGAGPSIVRILIKFDLSSISDVFVATSATLRVNNSFSDTGSQTLQLFRLMRDWTESGATWNTYDGTNNWAGAGAATVPTDIQNASFGTGTTAAGGTGVVSFNMTKALNPISINIVTSWFGAQKRNFNYGLRIHNNTSEAAFHKAEIDSSDNATPANRPMFIVGYQLGRMGVQYPY